MAKECPNCGAMVNDEADTCPECDYSFKRKDVYELMESDLEYEI